MVKVVPMLSRTLLLGTFLVAPLVAPVATAQTPSTTPTAEDTRARELYENGADLYKEGRYAEAILAWQESYKLSARHPLLLNIAGAQERLGLLSDAVDSIQRYRAFASSEERDELEQRVLALQQRIAAQPAPQPVVTAPAVVQPPPPEPTPVPVPKQTPSLQRTVGWAVFGTGAALGVAFGAVAGVSFGQAKEFKDAGDQAGWEKIRPLNNASIGLAATGGALAVAGVVVALTAPKDRGVAVLPTTDGFVVAGSF